MCHNNLIIFKITEDYIEFTNGEKLLPPNGNKFDIEIIEKIFGVET